jgi:SAM-dependent methyltransferase
LELGAGFGRLTREYDRYQQVVVLDYSTSLLKEAQAHLGRSERFVYVVANIYQLPLVDGVCDAAAMIRVIHHFADVPAALNQIRQALAPASPFILEYANKRNLKAMARHALRRQGWSPYAHEPVEFVRLNFDFHPRYMAEALSTAGFVTERRLALSYLRMGFLKRLLPTAWLVGLDHFLQPSAAWFGPYSPSVFTLNRAIGSAPASQTHRIGTAIFKCPACQHPDLETAPEHLNCPNCGRGWPIEDGIYNFKDTL